jgi:hypothetical protein
MVRNVCIETLGVKFMFLSNKRQGLQIGNMIAHYQQESKRIQSESPILESPKNSIMNRLSLAARQGSRTGSMIEKRKTLMKHLSLRGNSSEMAQETSLKISKTERPFIMSPLPNIPNSSRSSLEIN